MHEATILAALLRRIEDERRKQGALRVAAVYLRLGELSGVVPAQLRAALVAAQSAGLCGPLRLEIEHIACHWHCPACDLDSDGSGEARCCVCHGPTRLVGGDDLLLTGLDLEIA